MKRTVYFALLTTAIVILASITYIHSMPLGFSAFEQIEALTDDTGEIGPSIITCDSGGWGQCYSKHWETMPGHFFSDYWCEWTGYQKDYCPWWYCL